MARPGTPSLAMRLECVFRRFPIICGICSERIEWDADMQWDHYPVEVADGGPHCASNLRPVHSQPCHVRKSAKAEAQRHHIQRLERVKNGEPKRKRPKRKIPAKRDFKWPSRKMMGRKWG